MKSKQQNDIFFIPAAGVKPTEDLTVLDIIEQTKINPQIDVGSGPSPEQITAPIYVSNAIDALRRSV